ncbi:hypothetical protein E2C01_036575 [Portunus trituberculatus]|uniref:Uncharacterized protein n=1 Tax=Portunus trituberculatus TaxID=210409 RepID=A0A5B7F716_PORTR|nr:hypothetical protein [Portunus trituberculatus]
MCTSLTSPGHRLPYLCFRSQTPDGRDATLDEAASKYHHLDNLLAHASQFDRKHLLAASALHSVDLAFNHPNE